MTVEIHIHENTDSRVLRRLDRIEEALNQLLGVSIDMALDFAALEANAAAETDAIAALEAFIQTAFQGVKDESADQARINALADRMLANKSRLAAALLLGTPAEVPLP